MKNSLLKQDRIESMNPIYLKDNQPIAETKVLDFIYSKTPFILLDEKQKLFLSPKDDSLIDKFYILTSNLKELNNHLCLCQLINYEYFNRRYTAVVFDSIEEINEFLEKKSDYGILTQDEDFIYVVDNKAKGQII